MDNKKTYTDEAWETFKDLQQQLVGKVAELSEGTAAGIDALPVSEIEEAFAGEEVGDIPTLVQQVDELKEAQDSASQGIFKLSVSIPSSDKPSEWAKQGLCLSYITVGQLASLGLPSGNGGMLINLIDSLGYVTQLFLRVGGDKVSRTSFVSSSSWNDWK